MYECVCYILYALLICLHRVVNITPHEPPFTRRRLACVLQRARADRSRSAADGLDVPRVEGLLRPRAAAERALLAHSLPAGPGVQGAAAGAWSLCVCGDLW